LALRRTDQDPSPPNKQGSKARLIPERRRTLALSEPCGRPSLVVIAPAELAGTRVELGASGLIGFDPERADVVIDNDRVSNVHAAYTLITAGGRPEQPTVYELHDRKSTNGTYLMDDGARRRVPIERSRVNGFCRVHFGDIVAVMIVPPGRTSEKGTPRRSTWEYPAERAAGPGAGAPLVIASTVKARHGTLRMLGPRGTLPVANSQPQPMPDAPTEDTPASKSFAGMTAGSWVRAVLLGIVLSLGGILVAALVVRSSAREALPTASATAQGTSSIVEAPAAPMASVETAPPAATAESSAETSTSSGRAGTPPRSQPWASNPRANVAPVTRAGETPTPLPSASAASASVGTPIPWFSPEPSAAQPGASGLPFPSKKDPPQ